MENLLEAYLYANENFLDKLINISRIYKDKSGRIAQALVDIIKFESDEYIVEDSNVKFPLRIIDVLNDRRFIEIDILLNYSFDTKEVSEDDDLKIKKYRIELDVVTSKKKLKEIENFIKNNIENLP